MFGNPRPRHEDSDDRDDHQSLPKWGLPFLAELSFKFKHIGFEARAFDKGATFCNVGNEVDQKLLS
jgi:hypothetical protein